MRTYNDYDRAYKKTAKDKFSRDRYRLKLKAEAMSHYGGKCMCCGEEHLEFLTIDHTQGNGNTHRKTINVAGGYGMYLWLKRNGMPEGFQTLCFNCNMAKSSFGVCPHANFLQSDTQRLPNQEMAFLGRSGSHCRKVAGQARWL